MGAGAELEEKLQLLPPAVGPLILEITDRSLRTRLVDAFISDEPQRLIRMWTDERPDWLMLALLSPSTRSQRSHTTDDPVTDTCTPRAVVWYAMCPVANGGPAISRRAEFAKDELDRGFRAGEATATIPSRKRYGDRTQWAGPRNNRSSRGWRR